MAKDITQADPLLQTFWADLRPWFARTYPGKTLILTHVLRTAVEQLRLFCQGRMLPEYPGTIVTNIDGFMKLSKHNLVPAKAFDVAIMVGGKADWSKASAMCLSSALAGLGYRGKVVWGGDWTSFPDLYHFEIP